MGVYAPCNSTQSRQFINGLRNPEAQQFVSLSKPIDLVAAKQEARKWDVAELNQAHQHSNRQRSIGVLKPSNTCLLNSLRIEGDNKVERDTQRDKEIDHLQAQVCALEEQLEQERMLYDQSIKDLLEKVSCLEIEKGKAQLEAKQNRKLACKTNEYHIEEIAVLD